MEHMHFVSMAVTHKNPHVGRPKKTAKKNLRSWQQQHCDRKFDTHHSSQPYTYLANTIFPKQNLCNWQQQCRDHRLWWQIRYLPGYYAPLRVCASICVCVCVCVCVWERGREREREGERERERERGRESFLRVFGAPSLVCASMCEGLCVWEWGEGVCVWESARFATLHDGMRLC